MKVMFEYYNYDFSLSIASITGRKGGSVEGRKIVSY